VFGLSKAFRGPSLDGDALGDREHEGAPADLLFLEGEARVP
jgi:hypothetical protein